ncbi:hypothetical protein CHS0354_002014 [Potamilus streckersoni]|uniref:Cobalamin-independent methionine synthase MetE C-terminal/archaeal domain-containing protein n=1 Tax=Potamilus streckersoni TaxID=2493646 RepID=A0AAE0T5N2_9BIVA|nr:hypothetical protein CHS0354_002014 [Potamilus streckersoni]
MLTGPITILCWSFVRNDISRKEVSYQIALALRDEVKDLENAGITVIQIDEPAIREGLPLRKAEHPDYLKWSVRSFHIAADTVKNSTQIHTHMCYSEFNEMIDRIAALDADVISIEASRSNMELLTAFETFNYPNEIGPGVYDIHSPIVPETNHMVEALKKAAKKISADRLWVNPDCGLKTRGWPETDAAMEHVGDVALWRTLDIYDRLEPDFISVTCNAGGTANGRTEPIVSACCRKYSVPVAPHLTCLGQTTAEIDAVVQHYQSLGIKKIVSLRGDKMSESQSVGDFRHASDLVGYLKTKYNFELYVAGYPESHPESPSVNADIQNMKIKTDAGADHIITQFFFDPDIFLHYRDRLTKAGIKCDVIPGILPIINFPKAVSCSPKCGAGVPTFLHKMFDGVEPASEDHKILAMNVLSHQVTRLMEHGVRRFHFYTLNEITLTSHLCRWLKSAF